MFDAPGFELALYERSGGLIFGSYQRGGDFKSGHAALASGIGQRRWNAGHSAACAASKRSQGYSLATRAALRADVAWFDLRSQCENEV